jgi:hypothetical protein
MHQLPTVVVLEGIHKLKGLAALIFKAAILKRKKQ